MLNPTPLPPEISPLSSPRVYLVRMAVFLILVGFVAFILNRQLVAAFFGNPGLNGLIVGVMVVGIVLAVRGVVRLFREIRWVNHVSGADGRTLARPPVLLAPMAALIGAVGEETALSVATTRSLLDSVSARLDENRELVRYLAGLLVFLGLLGTFWGLIDTVNSVGRIIGSLRTGSDAAVLFDELKTNLAAPLSGMGVSFSASLFGLAGSLVLGFLDLQAGQASNRFYTELEDFLAVAATPEGPASVPATVTAQPAYASGPSAGDLALALDRLSTLVADSTGGRSTGEAIANLADGIQTLVHQMRNEQQQLRTWMESQATRERDLRATLDRLVRDRTA